jgi:hypothetical protein
MSGLPRAILLLLTVLVLVAGQRLPLLLLFALREGLQGASVMLLAQGWRIVCMLATRSVLTASPP